MTETPLETKDTSRTRRFMLSSLRMPRLVAPTPSPAPELRLRMRTKLVAAMVFAALVPVVIVALLATRVILSSLETGLREDADRQLAVGLNLVLRAVERLGDETVQLSESSDLVTALRDGSTASDAWLATQKAHIPSARLQLFDAGGKPVLERTLGSTEARFKGMGVQPGDAILAQGQAWTRGVFLVTVEDRVVMRAVAPVVDETLALRGVLVLSTPFDGDFADGIKGALAADVMLGGPSGKLEVTFRSSLGRRDEAVQLAPEDRLAATPNDAASRRDQTDLPTPPKTVLT